MPPLNLPPYGHVNAENAAFLAKRPIAEGFRLNPSSSKASDAAEWESWITDLSREMRDFLWPVWESGAWVGDAAQFAEDLTHADLALMRQLQPMMSARILGSAVTGLQRDAFLQEDTGVPGSTLIYYESKFPKMLEAELSKVILAGGRDIARPASQALKQVFQRPRAMQIALLWGIDINVQASASAITPAMISGHCIQGSLALANVHALMDEVLTGWTGVKDAMQRFLLDTGDRRVLAGLHYPSDNIGSWFVALRLCKHIFGADADRVRTSLWNAIQTHSFVYRALAAHATNSVYAIPLAKLKRAGEGA